MKTILLSGEGKVCYKPGMPNLPPLKTVRVQLRLSPIERDLLQALADKKMMTMSEYLRHLIHQEAKAL